MSRKAFTLLELLVGLAITALLLALLLPALRQAREFSQRVRCASNLRSLASAFESYCQDNRGRFPGVASIPQLEWDWIYWAPSQGDPFTEFGKGPLVRYLLGPDPRTFRCPSDDWDAHKTSGGHDAYPYSYLVNAFVANVPVNCCSSTGRSCVRVRNASDKLLLVEGDERTIHSGMWLPGTSDNTGEDLSGRHDPVAGRGPRQFRTNVAFVDTHVEFVPRGYADDPAHFMGGDDDGSATQHMPDYFLR